MKTFKNKISEEDIARRKAETYFIDNPNAKLAPISDYLLTAQEIYNPNDFEVCFLRDTNYDQYIMDALGPQKLGPKVITCKAQDWLYLHHHYYVAYKYKNEKLINDGSPITLTINKGHMMGRGNKLPSRFDMG